MFIIVPRALIPILTQKLLQAHGKMVIKKEWRRLTKLVRKGEFGTLSDQNLFSRSLEKKVMYWIEAGKIDTIDGMLEGAGLSSICVDNIAEGMQRCFINLAKTNPLYFYEFMVDAEKAQLDGINQLKESMGIGEISLQETNKVAIKYAIDQLLESAEKAIINEIQDSRDVIQSDTSSIIHSQELIIELLGEIKEQLTSSGGNFNFDKLTRLKIEDYPNDDEGNIHQLVNHFISHAITELNYWQYEAASRDLFRAAFLLFNAYKEVRDKKFYKLGNRCYSLGNTLNSIQSKKSESTFTIGDK